MMIKTTLLLLALLAGTASAQMNWNQYGIPDYTKPQNQTELLYPSWGTVSPPSQQYDAGSSWGQQQMDSYWTNQQRQWDYNNRPSTPSTQFESCSRNGVMSSYYRRCMGHY